MVLWVVDKVIMLWALHDLEVFLTFFRFSSSYYSLHWFYIDGLRLSLCRSGLSQQTIETLSPSANVLLRHNTAWKSHESFFKGYGRCG